MMADWMPVGELHILRGVRPLSSLGIVVAPP